jgi:hypothetical protein
MDPSEKNQLADSLRQGGKQCRNDDAPEDGTRLAL